MLAARILVVLAALAIPAWIALQTAQAGFLASASPPRTVKLALCAAMSYGSRQSAAEHRAAHPAVSAPQEYS